MDPNATLARIRVLAAQIQEGMLDEQSLNNVSAELAELTLALDEWMKNGGFHPRDWTPF